MEEFYIKWVVLQNDCEMIQIVFLNDERNNLEQMLGNCHVTIPQAYLICHLTNPYA